MRYWLPALLLIAGLVALQLALRSQNSVAPVASPDAVAFRLAFGTADKEPAKWDGSIAGGHVTEISGWRFAPGDRVDGTRAWQLTTETTLRGAETVLGPVTEKGVVITAEGATADTSFGVTTAIGSFSFKVSDIPFGASLSVLNGRVRVERVPTTVAITTSPDDQDYPALAVAGGAAYLTYVEFVHNNRSLESFAMRKEAPKNFDWLARKPGGDQVKLVTYSEAQRKWSGAESVSPPNEDIMRAAVAVDGRKRVWVIWSARRAGNSDLYARFKDAGRWSPEIRVTHDPGTDINPVAATDSSGRVWIAWQAYRSGNLDVLAAAQSGDRFGPEQRVSFSNANDWDPAIAAGPRGEIAVTWDTYDKGDYDVYARTMRYASAIEMSKPIAVAVGDNFDARSSAAYDPQDRLWVAYESAAEKWGKDFGPYDMKGVCLYRGHTLRVKCIDGDSVKETSGPLADALRTVPGLTGREMGKAQGDANPGMRNATVLGPRDSFPRIASDSQGRIFLTFRSGSGMRSQIASIWDQYLTWYDGSRWARPVEVPNTSGMLDFRPAMAAVAPGHLLMAAITDHRMRTRGAVGEESGGGDTGQIQADLISAEVQIPNAPSPAQLVATPVDTPAAPSADVQSERAAVSSLRAAHVNLAGREYSVMRGEFHRHTELSADGGADGPLIDAYRYLLDGAYMDWGGCCDHDNGGGREYAWWLQQKLTDAYFLPGAYIPMFSYERSVAYPEGHRNAIFVQRGVRPLPRLPKTDPDSKPEHAPDTQMLYAYLRQFHGIVASHTSATGMGTDWRDNDPVLEPVVEIYQGERQNYEMPGAPRSPSQTNFIGGFRPLGFVSLALQKGYRLGFEASSDHISTHESYCNLWVADRTREGVMEAFRKRRVYGSTDNILADVRCGDHFMGEEFTQNTAPLLKVHLVGTQEFARVQVIRDGEAAYTTTPNTRDAAFEWRDGAVADTATHYYYIRGEQKDGQLVWTSPMWIRRQ